MRIIRGMDAAKSLLTGKPTAEMERDISRIAQRIIGEVCVRGDSALLDFARKFDGVEISQLEITAEEIAEARDRIDSELLNALELAAKRIREFHTVQKRNLGLEFVNGGLGLLARPIERIGVYVPGGKASYPSTVLMTVIPARVAGVEEVFICTPSGLDGAVPAPTLAAAGIAGADRIFKVGGAQAVAALAYGTESVPRVDKICGPGNIYVTLAKKQVYGTVAIDGLHGPTETVIVADDSANPAYCAADLLAQAEHDEMASAILITTSAELADEVSAEVGRQIDKLERREIARVSLEKNGTIIVVADIDEAIDLVNLCAPEHLCLAVREGRTYLDRIRHAGGVFIDSPEALGDYTAGPSHVMPTGRTARFSSPLSVLDFLRVSILVDLDESALRELGPAAACIARAEGLTAHALSVEKRLENMKEGKAG